MTTPRDGTSCSPNDQHDFSGRQDSRKRKRPRCIGAQTHDGGPTTCQNQRSFARKTYAP